MGKTMEEGVLGKLLNRVLRRTGKDVALATAAIKAVGTVAKFIPPPPAPRSTLTLYLDDGVEIGWTAVPCERGDGSWNSFLKWYHGRQKSRTYVVNATDATTMIRRKDIRRYTITYWTA